MRDLRRDPCRAEARHVAHCSVVAAAVIGGGAALGSAFIGANAANKAGDKQIAGANASIGVQKDMFDTIRGDLSGYRGIGDYALPGLQRFLSGDPAAVQAQLEATPGYQFTRTQGLKAVQNGAAARGLGVSGAAMKGAATYATGLADSTFGAQFNRMLDAARLGESAAAQTGTFGTAAASGISNSLIGAANAGAGATIGGANAISGGLGGISNAILLSQLLGGGKTGGAGGGNMYTGPYPTGSQDFGP